MSDPFTREFSTIETVKGPLVFVREVKKAALGEMVSVVVGQNDIRSGQVIELNGDLAVIQVFGFTEKINPDSTVVRFLERQATASLSPLLPGRVFDGGGEPIDGQGRVIPHERRPIAGSAINPVSRDNPSDFIETGISAIDGMNTLVRGQKLPIFSGAGLPANEIASQIVVNARVVDEDQPFAVVFGGMGLTAREADFFHETFESTGAIDRVVAFINRADDPVIERLLTPRFALTVAEYLAFDLDMHALVVLTDMTQYCNALREVASSRDEIPGRRGYPGYMYTDLASIYERAGRIKGKKGSVTQLPILNVPDDDITHPIADLTGYITEGQIVLERSLAKKGVMPPIDVLPSLSRLMNQGIGEGKTVADQRELSDQLYMCYARGTEQRRVAAIIGEDGLSEQDRLYLQFADTFENEFIHQEGRGRTIDETIAIGWRTLSKVPRSDLVRVSRDTLDRRLPTADSQNKEEENGGSEK